MSGAVVFALGDKVVDGAHYPNIVGTVTAIGLLPLNNSDAYTYHPDFCVDVDFAGQRNVYTADGRNFLDLSDVPSLLLYPDEAVTQTWVGKSIPPAVQRTEDIDIAIERLGKFIERKANEWSRVLSVSYEESDEHVFDSFEEAVKNVEGALAMKHPVYVLKAEADHSVYGKPHVVWALRFWHEVLHYVLNADFSEAGEFKVSLAHIRDAEEEFGKGSLEAKLMHAETLGQVSYYWVHGEFVKDQKAFDLNYIKRF